MDWQVVHIRVNDAATGKPTPVRVRFSTTDGRYLPPLGHPAALSPGGSLPAGGNLRLGDKVYAYIDGTCEIRLPSGPVQAEISKGCEYRPLVQTVERAPGKLALRFTIERVSNLAAEGWYAGDTHVLGLPPHAAALEGAAEGLHVVNVLARETQVQDATCCPNLLEFSGQEPALVRDDCQVFVNTHHVGGALGDLSLLNCHRVVFPLTLGAEGFEKWALLDLCDQCHRKGGLVVWPEFPGVLGERLADLILDAVDAVEWTASPAVREADFGASGLPEWYRLLNCGFRVPLVGGSGKSDNLVPVGAVRTYVQLPPGEPVTYRAWIEAIRAGRTFATRGPLLRLTVDHHGPGGAIPAEPDRGLPVRAEVESVNAFDRLEVVWNGAVVAEAALSADGKAAVDWRLKPAANGWLAARCLGPEGLLAHTSPIYAGAGAATDSPNALPLFAHLQSMLQWIDDQVSNIEQRDRLRSIMTRARAELERQISK